MEPLPRAQRTLTEADGAIPAHDPSPPFPCGHSGGRGPRRGRDGAARPVAAAAAPGSAAEASELVRKAAEQLTALDEQVHEAD